jgi:hypothetical protein
MFLVFLDQRSSIIAIPLLEDKLRQGLSTARGSGVRVEGKTGLQRSGIDF